MFFLFSEKWSALTGKNVFPYLGPIPSFKNKISWWRGLVCEKANIKIEMNIHRKCHNHETQTSQGIKKNGWGINNDKTNITYETTDAQTKENCNRETALELSVEKLHKPVYLCFTHNSNAATIGNHKDLSLLQNLRKIYHLYPVPMKVTWKLSDALRPNSEVSKETSTKRNDTFINIRNDFFGYPCFGFMLLSAWTTFKNLYLLVNVRTNRKRILEKFLSFIVKGPAFGAVFLSAWTTYKNQSRPI